MIRVGIVGGGGYTAGELIRLLLNHPKVRLSFVVSKSQQGKSISEVHSDLLGDVALKFSAEFTWDIDALFLCMGHGKSLEFFETHRPPDDLLVIDLSRDFRLGGPFVYGLPELHEAAIKKSKRIANPGCFATAIQLALLPLAKAGQLRQEVHLQAITGATGAGQSLSPTSHFSWRNNNLSVYKAFTHQHLDEIKQSLKSLDPKTSAGINFIPIRGDFTRGIFASMYTTNQHPKEELLQLYRDFYKDAPFVRVSEENIHLKQVVNTNKCILSIHRHEDKVLIVSIIDNLLKGASGQAVQNMNLALGLEETMGLNLKASYF